MEEQKIQASILAQKQMVERVLNKKIDFIDPGPHVVKMSEVITDFAADYLDKVKTFSARRTVIGIACTAWNIALLKNKADRALAITKALSGFKLNKNSEIDEMKRIICRLIDRKSKLYGTINRSIVDYKLTNLGNNEFYLYIMSSVQEQDLISEYHRNDNFILKFCGKLAYFFACLMNKSRQFLINKVSPQ